jgi:hypothetical protein
MCARICEGVRVPGAAAKSANDGGASRNAFPARYASVATVWRRNSRSLTERLYRGSDCTGGQTPVITRTGVRPPLWIDSRLLDRLKVAVLAETPRLSRCKLSEAQKVLARVCERFRWMTTGISSCDEHAHGTSPSLFRRGCQLAHYAARRKPRSDLPIQLGPHRVPRGSETGVSALQPAGALLRVDGEPRPPARDPCVSALATGGNAGNRALICSVLQ